MRIIQIRTHPAVYSSNVYLLLGDFGRLEDINTLIDAGGDSNLIYEIRKIYTGAGKKPVDKIILTHNHFDHTAGVHKMKAEYNCRIIAFGKDRYIDESVTDGKIIRVADTQLQVIHVPEHSSDSICLYEWNTKVLFTGDTNFAIQYNGGHYSQEFHQVVEKLIRLGVNTIYPGHGAIIHNAQDVIEKTYKRLESHK